MASSTTATNAVQPSIMDAPNLPDSSSKSSKAQVEPVCPLRGAERNSITHFGRQITTLELTKEFFEEAEQGIVDYSEFLTTENDEMGVNLDERMVNHLFTTQVLELWDFGSPMAEKLLSQVNCPRMRRFWEVRTSPETFHLRNTNSKNGDFRWSQSEPPNSQRAKDKGMILMENEQRTVAVPMIGIISQLEELDFEEVRREIKAVNPKISTPTVVAVLKGILEHIYYDPLQAVREQRLKEIETIRTTRRKTRRVKGDKPSAKQIVVEEPSSSSTPSKPGVPAVATGDQASTRAGSTDVSSTRIKRQGAQNVGRGAA